MPDHIVGFPNHSDRVEERTRDTIEKLEQRSASHLRTAQILDPDRINANVHGVTSQLLKQYADPAHVFDLQAGTQWKMPRAGVVEHYAEQFHRSNKADDLVGKDPRALFQMFKEQGYAEKVKSTVERGQIYARMNIAGLPFWGIHRLKYPPKA